MPANDSLGPFRVLVVDDDRDTTDSLALLLWMWGFCPLVAYDGPTALAVAAAERPDVILLDIGLPGLDGYEVARRLRRQPWAVAVRLLALTGYGQEKDRQDADAAGFDRHLVKPFDPEELRQLLGRLPRPAEGTPLLVEATGGGGGKRGGRGRGSEHRERARADQSIATTEVLPCWSCRG
ncbi:MAG TPA: response regulator [Gemmataceae bacterium]|nr:response regulator [Gemmataceae bacterium]